MSIRLPHAWTTAAHCGTSVQPGAPYKCGTTVCRRPPPERDRAPLQNRFISWLLILVSLLAACMGGYILGITLLGAAQCHPTSLTIVASNSHVETHSHHNYGGTGGTRPASGAGQATAVKASANLVHGSGPERSLSDYVLRRAAAVQIPGALHDRGTVQAKAAVKQLQLVPCGKAGVDAPSCVRALAQPKVALMFLSTGDMPHEELWRTWLASAQGLVRADCWSAAHEGPSAAGGPVSTQKRALSQPASDPSLAGPTWRACGGGSPGSPAGDGVSQQHLFSVVVHTPPNHAGYPKGSLFHGKVTRSRVATDWGDHSLVEATQLLIREALEDPLNNRFVLLSEACVPLYSAPATYLQLMGQPLSRINACSAKDSTLNSERWRELLLKKGGLSLQHWRKSAQWFGLTRSHAQLVAADTQLVAAFGELCRLQRAEEGASFLNCHSDENYIPSLLAKAGLDNETDCVGGLTYSEWSVSQYGDAYPRYFLPSEISGDFIEHLRSPEDTCETANADSAVASTFVRLNSEEGGSRIGVHPCTRDQGIAAGPKGNLSPARPHPALALSDHCPLFARKFSRFTAKPLLGLCHVDEGLAIFHGACN